MALFGGCLCGAIRFEATADPLWVTHCHCSMCRKTSGAAFSTWVSVPADKLRFVKGKPTRFPSSREARRGFCSVCGSSLTMQYVGTPDVTDVALGSLDDPAAVTPSRHIWTESRLPWVHTDDLPSHGRGPNEDAA